MATHAYVLDGTILGGLWCLPFVGVLLSLAILPVVQARLWHRHYGKICALWATGVLVALLNHCGIGHVQHLILEVVAHDYVPFIVLIAALYTTCNSATLFIDAPPSTFVNVCILSLGSILASVIGTTGAAMLLIHPMIEINRARLYKKHSIIFFIFMVCNVGGCLSPLGDPPLFLGFLNGVHFFWVTKNLFLLFCVAIGLLLSIYILMDSYYFRREKIQVFPHHPYQVKIYGMGQLMLLAAIPCIVMWTASMDLKVWTVQGVAIKGQSLLRDGALALIIVISIALHRTKNHPLRKVFSWHPFYEIAKVFAAIFVAAIPVLAILKAGENGILKFIVHLLNDPLKNNEAEYFWLTGLLSAFLDNAPTYLIFFNATGQDVSALMTRSAGVLTAISAGAVFMGAVSYIGNAPNLMVKSMAEYEGIAMPHFFQYLLWSFCILGPIFIVMTLIFF